ncbi:uncharacterized protein LOC131074220 isoform X2 [Cryptomeria japonica]|uniref:uncharacterized protein LOC131074220 isoform X2 n=1 Tax=Cryptomeria japonica TaxID=3369 RepID=UPI0027DA24B5|nr:uncharacterized protein LOC131074220 isoform X2 [Cryptomeria japonica]XP_057866775.2 uncharacterized protein LOC131074220 isoform X2 [Cryptomeria japonica]
MSGGYSSLPTSHLLGSVPAAVDADHKALQFEEANLEIFPPSNTQGGTWGYHSPNDIDGGEGSEQAQGGWKGFFSIASYRPYFNIDTYDVVERTMATLYAQRGDFLEKIQHNPDLYGPAWISTTLVFMVTALGNYASYLSYGQGKHTKDWYYDINYVSWAAFVIYGYICLVPLGYYFLLKYLSIPTSFVQLCCLCGYSLFIFIPSSLLLIFPTEFLRWTVIILAGIASSWFLAFNLRSYIMTMSDKWATVVASAFAIQLCLALTIKFCFFV